MTELEKSGIKLTPENVVAASRLPDGRIVFLEQGNSSAGLQHIVERHATDFANKGISQVDIPSVVMSALNQGNIVGTSGSASVYEVIHNGSTQYVAIGVSKNGYIVRANPVSTWKEIK
ncbi:hypothetical protein [Herbaspirillum autotrophicum]|uniref:hypothetical protein n=1 Tax=Herbaspirillum autotrophicum TaxID=180195 RepID=UPI0018DB9DFC|nr:hypothetical protein [Herbaspirillum autotrophicum]